MALKLSSVMLGSPAPKELAEFYKGVLGEAKWIDEKTDWSGWDAGGMWLVIGPHSEVKGRNDTPGRIMFCFETSDVTGEFERIKELGGDVIQEPYKPGEAESGTMATFADPDGNYFQLMTPDMGQ